MHKHTSHFGGLVGAPHPAFDALIGSAGGTRPRQDGRQVARAKANQGVVRVQAGDDQLAHFAFRHRVTGTRTHNFNNDAFIQHQTLARTGFVSNEAHIGSGIALVSIYALGGHPIAQARWKGLA